MKKSLYLFLGIALVVILLISAGLSGPETVKQVGAQANVPCYGEQGGAKHVAGSGCEYEFQSGSSLDIQSGSTFSSSTGLVNSNWLRVAAPTAIGTATPAVVIQNAGVSNALEIRNSGGTPVFYVDGSGAATYSGFSSGGGNVGGAVKVTAAPATATPLLRLDNRGAGNVALSVEKDGTPVFEVGNGGSVTGYVLSSSVSGRKCVQGTTTITGTGAIAHGLSTPVAVQLSLAEDVTGDGSRVSYTNASATVTAKVWNSAATPAAASSPHVVDYTVCGTP